MSTLLTRKLLHLPPAIRRHVFSAFASTSASSSKPEVYDVVCIGGGPAGLSLVSALRSKKATQQLKIALIDGQEFATSQYTPAPDLYSNRCSSLTPSSLEFLEDIGAWQAVDKARIRPYHGMEVWDGVSGSKIAFDSAEVQSGLGTSMLDTLGNAIPGNRTKQSQRAYGMRKDDDAIATMCENSNLTGGLLRRLKDLRGVEMLDNTKVENIQLGPDPQDEMDLNLSQWPIISLSDTRRLAARLLVGADGANSPVRNFANIPSPGWDYNQHGVVATLHLDKSFGDGAFRTAYQRFLPSGPIALLPLPDHRASLVWSMTTPLPNAIKKLAPEQFIALLNAALRLELVDLQFMLANLNTSDPTEELQWRLSNTPISHTGAPPDLPNIVGVQNGSVASFPLRMRHASTYTGHRIALIGDAAHTIHPLAGQGLNLGLADSKSLAKRIVYGMENGMDIGTSWCLDTYNSDRWAKNNAIMGVCDKMQKLYSANSGPIVWGRSLGLEVMNRLTFVKGMLMGAAGS